MVNGTSSGRRTYTCRASIQAILNELFHSSLEVNHNLTRRDSVRGERVYGLNRTRLGEHRITGGRHQAPRGFCLVWGVYVYRQEWYIPKYVV